MSGIMLLKGADKRDYLLGRFTNRFRDRDIHSYPQKGGEIISSYAHKEFNDFLDKHPEQAPELWIWHTRGTAMKSRATWWDWTGNFFYVLFPLEPDEAKGLKKWAEEETLGMSHGFYALAREDDGIISQYRTLEVSVLPVSEAANTWTEAVVVSGKGRKEVMTPKKKAALATVFGDDTANLVEKTDEEMAAELEAAGVDTKALDGVEGDADEAATEVADTTEAALDEKGAEDAIAADPVAVLAGEVLATFQSMEAQIVSTFAGFTEAMSALTARIDALEAQGESEKSVAVNAARPIGMLLAGYAPSIVGKKEAEEDGRSSLAKQAPVAPPKAKPNVMDLLIGRTQV